MVRREISVFSKPVVFDKIYKGGNKVAIRYNKDRALIPVNEIMFYNGDELEYVGLLPDMLKYLKDCFYIKDDHLYIKGDMNVTVRDISPEYDMLDMYFVFNPFSGKYREYQVVAHSYYDKYQFKVADYAWELVDE